MRRKRLVRIVAAALAAALVIVGLAAAPAHAAEVTVSGTVILAATGGPATAGDAYITVIGNYGQEEGTGFTRADGTYSIAGVPEGTGYRITFSSRRTDSMSIWHDGQSLMYDSGSFTIDGPVAVDVMLPKSGHVAGTVTLAGAMGDDGVAIKYRNCGSYPYRYCSDLTTGWKMARTDATGHFDLTGLSGGWLNIEARHDSGLYVDRVHPNPVLIRVDQTHTELTTAIDLPSARAPQGGTITGHVFLGNHDRSADAGQVRIDGAGTTYTDVNGNYSLSGLDDGTYALTYTYLPDTEFRTPQPPRTVTIAPGSRDQPRIDATMFALGSITGRVWLGTTSTRASAGQVRVTATGGNPLTTASALTDNSGNYTVEGLEAGEYVIRFDYLPSGDFADQYYEGYYADRQQPTVNAYIGFDQRWIVAILEPGASVSGRVIDVSGDPVAGVHVTGRASYGIIAGGDAHSTPYETTTDSTGRYTLSGLPPGAHWRFRFTAEGEPSTFRESDVERSLDAGQAVLDQDVTMYHPTFITGSLSCAGCLQGHYPPYTGTVEIEGPADSWAEVSIPGGSVTSTIDGGFVYGGLIPGRYRLTLTSPGRTTIAVAPFVVADGDRHDLHEVGAPFAGSLLSRDFTGDGAADILYRDSLGQLMIYAGNGAGGFAGKTLVAKSWGGFTAVLHAGDFNGDGFADVVARSSVGYLYLYRGNGAGGFLGKSTISTSSFWKTQTALISPGDFNGDGFTDLISRDSTGYLWLNPGNGSGGLGSKVKIGSSGWKAFTAVLPISDFDEDGAPDLAARDSSGVLWLYPGNGTGGFKPRVKLGTGWGGMTAIRSIGDFDGDRHADVIARDATGYLWLYKGNGVGKFTGKVKIGSSGWKAFKLAT